MAVRKHKTGFRGPSPDVGKPYRWKKGQSGNPKGRPRSTLLSEAYKAALAEIDPKKQKSHAEVIASTMIAEAKRGKVPAASEMADRVEGKPRQSYDVKLSVIDTLAERIRKAREAKKR